MALRGSSAKRYAEALLDLALERRSVDEWRESLDRVAAGFSADVLKILSAPSIGMEPRRRAIELATADEPIAIRALLVQLFEREQVRLLPQIARAFHALLDERAGIEPAVIATAVPLDEAARRELVERLERESGRRLRASFAVDPDLLGGAVVRVGDHQLDGSLRTRLDLLRQRLAAGT